MNYEPLNFETDFGGAITSTVLRIANDYQSTPLQLVWRDYGKNRPLQLHIHYRNDYFESREIELLAGRLLFLIEQFPTNTTSPIIDLDVLSITERLLIGNLVKSSSVAYPRGKSIVDLFEEQVLKTAMQWLLFLRGRS